MVGDELGMSLIDNGKKFKIDSMCDGQLETVEAEMAKCFFVVCFWCGLYLLLCIALIKANKIFKICIY